jgi:tetratricopeptide (TPR) repeat protein
VCERALRRPELARSAETHAQILITLACFRSELGDVSDALDRLDQALAVDPGRRAAVLNARGMILLRNSHPDALPALEDAIDLLSAEREGEAASRLASALLNRGFIHMTDGRLTQARADTAAAERVAAEAGRQGVVLLARHNLGYIRFLSGDLPGALHDMSEASALMPDSDLALK